MRIALISDCALPRLGGIEVQVADLAAQLRRMGQQVIVATATPGPVSPGVVRSVYPVPFGVPVHPRAGAHLRAVIEGADVVHAHVGILGPFAQQGAHIAAAAGVPTVMTWHSLLAGSPLTTALAPAWRRLVAAGVLPTAVSSVAAEQVSHAIRAVEVAVLPNGLDLAQWTPGDDIAGVAAGSPPRVISASRFAVRKRPLHLLQLMARVRAQVAPVDRPELSILGDGPWWSAMRQWVARTDLRHWVSLPGRVSRADVLSHLRNSDLYVAPSRREAFGIAALEARSAGLPIAGYAACGVRDIVEPGYGGVLADSADQLRAQLVSLLGDRSRLAQYAAYHRAHRPHQYAWPTVGDVTLAAYQQVYRGRSGSVIGAPDPQRTRRGR